MALTPRTKYSQEVEAEAEMLTNLTMNIDPSTIKALKGAFERSHGSLNRKEFIVLLRKELKHWKPSLPNRDAVMIKLLNQLFNDIDLNGNRQLDWEEFTNYIIEKGVVHGSERHNRVDSIKSYSVNTKWPPYVSDSSIEHLVNMESIDRFAVIENYSSEVKFFHHETGQPFGRNLVVRNSVRQDLFSSPERVFVNNGVYLARQNLFLVSCNDGTLRPYGNNGTTFYPAVPESGYSVLEADHVQRTLTWDDTNEVLYTGEHSGQVNLWKLQDRRPLKRLPQFHTGMITDLVTVPRLEFLFSSSQDRTILLWDTITGRPHRCYSSHQKGILALSFNAEYRLLFSAGFDHDIFVWNPYIESLAFKVEGHNASLVSVQALEGTNQIVSADIDGWVKVWDIRNFGCVYSVNIEDKQHNNRLEIADFIHLKKQERLVVGGQRLVTLDYDKNFSPSLVDDHTPLFTQYSPYTSKLFTTVSNKVKVWNAFTGQAEHIYAMSEDNEISFATLDCWCRRIIVGSVKGQTTVYNLQNGALMKRLHPHKSEVNFIASSRALKLIVTASLDMTMAVHADKELNETAVLRLYTDLGGIITALHVLGPEGIITGNSEGIIQTWNLENRQPEPTVMNHTGEVTNIVRVTEHSLIISSDTTGELALWGIGRSIYKYSPVVMWTNGNEGAVNWMAYHAGILYTADDKGFVKAARIAQVLEFVSREESVKKIGPQPSERSVIPAEGVEYLYAVKVHSEPIKHLSLIHSPLTLITTGFDKKARLLDAATGKCVGALQQGTLGKKGLIDDAVPWLFNIDVATLQQVKDLELQQLRTAVLAKERHHSSALGPLYRVKSEHFTKPPHSTLLKQVSKLHAATSSKLSAKHRRIQLPRLLQPSARGEGLPTISRSQRPSGLSYFQALRQRVSQQAVGYAAQLVLALEEYDELG